MVGVKLEQYAGTGGSEAGSTYKAACASTVSKAKTHSELYLDNTEHSCRRFWSAHGASVIQMKQKAAEQCIFMPSEVLSK